jgi:DNA-binding CsgD family transcriptional regulator
LLTTSGRDALRRGALATAIGTLRRAAALLSDAGQRAAAEVLLVESLALAGRVDEATAIGDRLVLQMPDGGQAHARTVVHLKLAHAAVDGTRWADARRQLGIVADLLAAGPDAAGPDAAGAAAPDAGLAAETAVLNAEVAFADSDLALAERLSAAALAQPEASAEVRCHAHELLGRLRRGRSLDAARASFERALATAEAAGLAVWRLRALHELGTIDMFDNAGAARLSQARQIAGELGAASTGAVIDVQLTACAMFRFDLVEADLHARAALEISARLRLAKTHAIALLFLGEVSALRRDRAAMDHFLAVAQAAEPDDPEIEGSALAGARGMLALLEDDQPTALEYLRRGVALLDSLPQQGPAPYRALWPLLLAATADPDALAAISHARGIGLPVNRVNRGLLGYADAILAGRSGQQDLATRLADAADGELRNYPVWADLARLYAAGPALADDWGQPRHWLVAADGTFSAHGIEPLAARCRRLLSAPPRSSWARLGITERQADVLRLVADGSSNKEIAARLHLSARTVEKHVEALLRLTGARSRTQLVARAGLEYPD